MEFCAHEACSVAGHAHLIGHCNMFLNVVNVIDMLCSEQNEKGTWDQKLWEDRILKVIVVFSMHAHIH